MLVHQGWDMGIRILQNKSTLRRHSMKRLLYLLYAAAVVASSSTKCLGGRLTSDVQVRISQSWSVLYFISYLSAVQSFGRHSDNSVSIISKYLPRLLNVSQ